MATLAEQNAVRCKEAGNVLYKSERYEEVSSEQNACFYCARACVYAFASSIFRFYSQTFLLLQIFFSTVGKARARL